MKHLHRSTSDRFISGVLGGLAEHFSFDPSILRLAFVVGVFITGIFPLVFVYIIMAIIVPER